MKSCQYVSQCCADPVKLVSTMLTQCWPPVGDRWRSATLSLDGLLDYDESDKDEVTFELSMFAESFQDMLMRDYGETVYEALQTFR